MRVITGSARGTKLIAPEGFDTRPTSDMAKEAIFSAIQFYLEEACVLDLFAGSGQLGIEALSRGAKYAVFVDSSREALDAIKTNLTKTKMFSKAKAAAMDFLTFLKHNKENFDIVFADPPYNSGYIPDILKYISDHLNENGMVICETERKEQLPESCGELSIFKTYNCGKAKFTVYKKA